MLELRLRQGRATVQTARVRAARTRADDHDLLNLSPEMLRDSLARRLMSGHFRAGRVNDYFDRVFPWTGPVSTRCPPSWPILCSGTALDVDAGGRPGGRSSGARSSLRSARPSQRAAHCARTRTRAIDTTKGRRRDENFWFSPGACHRRGDRRRANTRSDSWRSWARVPFSRPNRRGMSSSRRRDRRCQRTPPGSGHAGQVLDRLVN